MIMSNTTNAAATKTFRIYLANFGYFMGDEYTSFADAVARAKSTSFECTIYRGKEMVAAWGYFSGLKIYNRRYAA